MLILVVTVYVHVKSLLHLMKKEFEYTELNIYPRADVHFIVFWIYSAQSETSAALKERGQIDVIPCIFQAMYCRWS